MAELPEIELLRRDLSHQPSSLIGEIHVVTQLVGHGRLDVGSEGRGRHPSERAYE